MSDPQTPGDSDSAAHVDPDAGFHHQPVMLDEIVEIFATVPPGIVVDATLGGAGHSRALLDAHDHLGIIGIDRDGDAVAIASRRLAPFGERATVVHARFDEIRSQVQRLDAGPIVGVLFDLGVSSPQLDRGERGFSYRSDAPLDMRMDRRQHLSADEVVNTYGHGALASLLRRFSDERFAGRIATAIIENRPIHTTAALADVVRSAVPAAARRRGGHPARRSFQAIRIEVNQELELLPAVLDDAIDLLVPGGRIAVLSYHSGEDRVVKDRFVNAADGGCTCPPDLPCGCGAIRTLSLARRASTKPSPAEVEINPRAEAARLRVGEKLAVVA